MHTYGTFSIQMVFRNRQTNRNWRLKLNTLDKYLLCPVPKSGWSSWKRLWFYTSKLIHSYDTDVGIQEDSLAGVNDINSYQMKAKWLDGSYNYSFVFFR